MILRIDDVIASKSEGGTPPAGVPSIGMPGIPDGIPPGMGSI